MIVLSLEIRDAQQLLRDRSIEQVTFNIPAQNSKRKRIKPTLVSQAPQKDIACLFQRNYRSHDTLNINTINRKEEKEV